MSETTPTYILPARADGVRHAPTHEERIAHIGELAVAWMRAQDAWENAPRHDQVELRRMLREADTAQERLRVACLALLATEADG